MAWIAKYAEVGQILSMPTCFQVSSSEEVYIVLSPSPTPKFGFIPHPAPSSKLRQPESNIWKRMTTKVRLQKDRLSDAGLLCSAVAHLSRTYHQEGSSASPTARLLSLPTQLGYQLLIFSSQYIIRYPHGLSLSSALEVCAFITSSLDYSKMQFRLRFKKLKWAQNATELPYTEKGHWELPGISLFLNSWQRTQQSLKDLSPYR